MICLKCGSENPRNAKFCKTCGENLEREILESYLAEIEKMRNSQLSLQNRLEILEKGLKRAYKDWKVLEDVKKKMNTIEILAKKLADFHKSMDEIDRKFIEFERNFLESVKDAKFYKMSAISKLLKEFDNLKGRIKLFETSKSLELHKKRKFDESIINMLEELKSNMSLKLEEINSMVMKQNDRIANLENSFEKFKPEFDSIKKHIFRAKDEEEKLREVFSKKIKNFEKTLAELKEKIPNIKKEVESKASENLNYIKDALEKNAEIISNYLNSLKKCEKDINEIKEWANPAKESMMSLKLEEINSMVMKQNDRIANLENSSEIEKNINSLKSEIESLKSFKEKIMEIDSKINENINKVSEMEEKLNRKIQHIPKIVE